MTTLEKEVQRLLVLLTEAGFVSSLLCENLVCQAMKRVEDAARKHRPRSKANA